MQSDRSGLRTLQCSTLRSLCQRNDLCYLALISPAEVPLSKSNTLHTDAAVVWLLGAQQPPRWSRLTGYSGIQFSPQLSTSTHRPCRWDSTGPARTLGPRTLSEGRPPQNTAPPRLARTGTSHMETPG